MSIPHTSTPANPKQNHRIAKAAELGQSLGQRQTIAIHSPSYGASVIAVRCIASAERSLVNKMV